MATDILLLAPHRGFFANRFGLGYQLPLGLVLLGGPLLDAGHRVSLLDADRLGLRGRSLVARVLELPPRGTSVEVIRDALMREESCGGHFREEHQTDEGEAKRDDANFTFVSAWEYTGENQEPVMHKEDLVFENVELKTRSYK